VLLAEDDVVNTYIFCAMLEEQGLHIETASNGLAALEMLRTCHYDIAFLDVQMPGLDGLELTRQLRSWETAHRRPRLPVVSLTANAFASDVQASLDAGSDRHLAKPYSKAQLLDMLKQLAPGSPTAPPGCAPDAGTPPTAYQPDQARKRLGVDNTQFRRTTDHAAVFLAGWESVFVRARVDSETGLVLGLASDLVDVATRIGADALRGDAAELQRVLNDGAADAAVQAAVKRVQQSLVPVVFALTNSPKA
jgi:CheY-like chemotaxis protein